jgi:hypothetical protein
MANVHYPLYHVWSRDTGTSLHTCPLSTLFHSLGPFHRPTHMPTLIASTGYIRISPPQSFRLVTLSILLLHMFLRSIYILQLRLRIPQSCSHLPWWLRYVRFTLYSLSLRAHILPVASLCSTGYGPRTHALNSGDTVYIHATQRRNLNKVLDTTDKPEYVYPYLSLPCRDNRVTQIPPYFLTTISTMGQTG